MLHDTLGPGKFHCMRLIPPMPVSHQRLKVISSLGNILNRMTRLNSCNQSPTRIQDIHAITEPTDRQQVTVCCPFESVSHAFDTLVDRSSGT